MRHLIVSQVAKQIGHGAVARDISDLFTRGLLDCDRCPLVGDRRLVPENYVEEIRRVLESRGRLSACREPVSA
jgi:hypothetical protein